MNHSICLIQQMQIILAKIMQTICNLLMGVCLGNINVKNTGLFWVYIV